MPQVAHEWRDQLLAGCSWYCHIEGHAVEYIQDDGQDKLCQAIGDTALRQHPLSATAEPRDESCNHTNSCAYNCLCIRLLLACRVPVLSDGDILPVDFFFLLLMVGRSAAPRDIPLTRAAANTATILATVA
eukprot:CAMPEP_0174732898 /NCGR_PEP_ID=MMETSP1094-20130205/60221_1 /TAXON_ID=156173 /ORGANISM="Chrysochromulina brevifilum, Strain UTEX LB 985" /LENGTH=130 /DNA_ID=CAMNT_0015935467 /DNA_START=503 /DNA_END=893 /DNA_ORIENTATION=-